jgi:hypothetical protein
VRAIIFFSLKLISRAPNSIFFLGSLCYKGVNCGLWVPSSFWYNKAYQQIKHNQSKEKLHGIEEVIVGTLWDLLGVLKSIFLIAPVPVHLPLY